MTNLGIMASKLAKERQQRIKANNQILRSILFF